jgi:chaperone BCS1
MDTIYLPNNIKLKIHNDVKKFLNPKTKKKYQEFGIPYKRNYLFEGIPGTGKTSLITSIGSALDLNVSIMTFDNKTTDNIFMKAITHLEDNTLLVLEDIDTLFQERKKNDELKNMITFSGILNILDGLAHKEGLITIMTTNYKDRLDPALIRPGRVDMVIHFDYAVKEQIIEIFNKFFPKLDANKFHKELHKTRSKVTTSMLQQYLFSHLDDELVFENLSELTKLAQDNKFGKKPDGFYT